MLIRRSLIDELKSSRKSFLLLGPRQVGKSTLIRELKPDLEINLAHETTFLDFAQNPGELENRLEASGARHVFIDEIQRLPRMLNTIQVIIDSSRAPRFYLTGSSARKLRRGRANLLPGRIFSFQLGGLTSRECNHHMNTDKALAYGCLPGIYIEKDHKTIKKLLLGYASTYLREEIQSEALTRNLEGFARFLGVAASQSGKVLDFSKLSSLSQVPRQSAIRYFEILEDTLIASRCEVHTQNISVRLVSHPKFYFFDNGVLNGVLRNFSASPDRLGFLFENFIFTQLKNSAHASDEEVQIRYFRTEGGSEVDFIVEREGEIVAIEAKAKRTLHADDLRGLKSFREHCRSKHKSMIFYLGNTRKKIGDIQVTPWQEGLSSLGW